MQISFLINFLNDKDQQMNYLNSKRCFSKKKKKKSKKCCDLIKLRETSGPALPQDVFTEGCCCFPLLYAMC